MIILCLGLNHRTTPLAYREVFSLEGDDARQAMIALAAKPAIDEAVVLSTCNRMEWYLAAADGAAAAKAVHAFLENRTGFPFEQLEGYLYHFEGRQAVEHLMRVASGLDSMVLGEPQILGQVRSAYDMGLATQTIGPALAELFRDAIAVGKKARTETAISRNAVSIGTVAMQLVAAHTSAQAKPRLAVVGAGEMGTLVAQYASKLGHGHLRILNRTLERAERLARQTHATAHPLSQLPETLAWADAVIVAARGADYLVQADMLKEDRTTPLLLLDLSVPRAIDPALAEHPGVQLFVLDDLQQVVQRNLAERQAAIPQVEALIAEGVQNYMSWLQGREVLPVLVGMRRKANDLARAELELALRKLPTDDPAVADQMTRLAHRLVNKLLHEPTIRLKEQAAQGRAEPYAQALSELFALETARE